MHIFAVRPAPAPGQAALCELDFQQTGSVWVTPKEAGRLPLVPLQLRGRVAEVLKAPGPIYLGTVRRDEVCM